MNDFGGESLKRGRGMLSFLYLSPNKDTLKGNEW